VLKSLSIKNYALIDTLNIEFSADLNILTGETGAGKSILLGAIGLIIGQRADSSVLRNKSEKCTVEGVFEISKYSLIDFFDENELDYEEVSILRREITPQGKSRAFINDTPVNVKVLHDLGLRLIDIHSQHQSLELNEKYYQLHVVDLIAASSSLLKTYRDHYRAYHQLLEELRQTKLLADQARKDLDYYEYQHQQLAEAKLKAEEQEYLEIQLGKLTHAEEIKSVFGTLTQTLSAADQSVVSILKENLNQIGKLKNVFPDAALIHSRLESVYIELKDIADESALLEERTDIDPDRIEQINQRLDLIYTLQQKHRVSSIAELISIENELQAKIQMVSSYDGEIEALTKSIQAQKNQLSDNAIQLSQLRKSVTPIIEKKVIEILRQVGIPNAELMLKFNALSDYTASGIDEVSFMFSANKNQELQEIGKIASGGEISRLMLAIKTLITHAQSLPTIIFDEIDAGISGEVALKMGQILESMSAKMQILNITHLPQIAARGNNHYKVYKYDNNEQTFTTIRKLTDNERVEEIAQMLSGEKFSKTAMETAKELLL